MPAGRLLDRPDHAAQHAGRDLQRGGAVVAARARAPRSIVSCEPYQKAPLPWPMQQDAELVHAGDDLVHHQALLGLLLPAAAGQLVHRQHRVVAGVVGVVHGRPVERRRRRRAVSGSRRSRSPRCGSPGSRGTGPQLGVQVRTRVPAPGLVQVDRRAAAADVAPAALGEVPLVRAPAELGRLAALGDEAVDRPGVDELARALGPARRPGCRARRCGSP